jgi:2-C-methyl-D-erythritol 2,4-cyclodiphosphate synthase
MRIGQGYDVHAFGVGDRLILGGVHIPFDRAFVAHSDGDVLVHALIDSLLGGLGLGDIGQHFPDTNEKYRDCDSLDLLSVAAEMMSVHGYCLGNADLTIVAQRPKMAPYLDAMKLKISAVLGCDKGQVNIKATTTERLGFTGREEGIACYATALLVQLVV